MKPPSVRVVLAVAATCLWLTPAAPADDGLAPRAPVPKRAVRADDPAGRLADGHDWRLRLVVKFVDAAQVRAEEGAPRSRRGADLSALRAVLAEHDAALRPLMDAPEAQLEALQQRAAARSGRAQPDLGGLHAVSVGGVCEHPDAGSGDPSARARLAALGDALVALDLVEFAEIETLGAPPPGDIAPTTPNLQFQQGYRGPNPGIGADWAESLGLTGADLRISDCEYGWVYSHEDLVDVDLHPEPGQTIHPDVFVNGWEQHGTAALGELAAVDNAYGCKGLAPHAEYHTYPEWTLQGGWRRLAAITNAIAASDPGDLVLLEMQTASGGPAELDTSIWLAVKVGTDAGVVVVGAAGNGDLDLDSGAYAFWQNLGDSGAILVGAGTASTSHAKLSFSSYGSRVDLQGWGTGVFTLGYGWYASYGGDNDQKYTAGFSGTSSAAPIVTGAAALVQQRALEKSGLPMDPVDLREHLVEHGIPQGGGEPIGPFPNLGAAIGNLPPGPWTDLGGGLAGTTGEPTLSGWGALQDGTPGWIRLDDAAPAAPCLLFVAFQSQPVPFVGGTLQAFPFVLDVPLVTSASGTLFLPFTWDFGLPAGFELFLQTAVADGGAPQGVALSNALRGVTG